VQWQICTTDAKHKNQVGSKSEHKPRDTITKLIDQDSSRENILERIMDINNKPNNTKLPKQKRGTHILDRVGHL